MAAKRFCRGSEGAAGGGGEGEESRRARAEAKHRRPVRPEQNTKIPNRFVFYLIIFDIFANVSLVNSSMVGL